MPALEASHCNLRLHGQSVVCASRSRARPGSQHIGRAEYSAVRSVTILGASRMARVYARYSEAVRTGKGSGRFVSCGLSPWSRPRSRLWSSGWSSAFKRQRSAIVAQVCSPSSRAHSMRGCFKCPPIACRVWPNPSFNRRANGTPPGPGRWYSVHCHRPGPGGAPLAPG